MKKLLVFLLISLLVAVPVYAANVGKWNAPTAQSSILTTEMNGLSNNTATAASSAVANQTNLDIYWDCTLHLASLSPAAGAYVTVYILEATDDATYPSATGSVLRNQPAQVLFSMGLDTTAATAQDIVVRNVVIPPHSFKIVLDNQAGVALGATGNTLKCSPYDINLNG